MFNNKKTRQPVVLKESKRQTGTSNILKDTPLAALLPGKRLSKEGNIYYEYRKNRSDLRGRFV